LEGLCPEQCTPKIEPELGCALLKLLNQIANLRNLRGSFTGIWLIVSISLTVTKSDKPVFQIPDQRYDTPWLQYPRKFRCRGIVVRTPVKGLKRRGKVSAVLMRRCEDDWTCATTTRSAA
jgi:hypothetical protein